VGVSLVVKQKMARHNWCVRLYRVAYAAPLSIAGVLCAVRCGIAWRASINGRDAQHRNNM